MHGRGLALAALGFEDVTPYRRGRASYHPAVLLKRYIYGYFNCVQSSRRIEKEARRIVELMCLIDRLAPDFKTITIFYKDHREAIGAVRR